MSNRKMFLSGVAAAATAVTMAARAKGAPTAQPSPTPQVSPTPPPAPSAAALALATGMRKFDAALSDDEVQKIARSIDDGRRAGANLNPKDHPLANSDEPVTVFSVPAL